VKELGSHFTFYIVFVLVPEINTAVLCSRKTLSLRCSRRLKSHIYSTNLHQTTHSRSICERLWLSDSDYFCAGLASRFGFFIANCSANESPGKREMS